MVARREQGGRDGDRSLLQNAFRGDIWCAKSAGERYRILGFNFLQSAFWITTDDVSGSRWIKTRDAIMHSELIW
jgi:hypothetical protein